MLKYLLIYESAHTSGDARGPRDEDEDIVDDSHQVDPALVGDEQNDHQGTVVHSFDGEAEHMVDSRTVQGKLGIFITFQI